MHTPSIASAARRVAVLAALALFAVYLGPGQTTSASASSGSASVTPSECSRPAWTRAWQAPMAPWTGGNVPPILPWNPGMVTLQTLATQVVSMSDRTLRVPMVVRVGGNQVRLHFSNRYGLSPLKIGKVTIGRGHPTEPSGVSGSQRMVTFNGADSITAPAHSDVVSDPVGMKVAGGSTLTASIYLKNTPFPVTEHPDARQRVFLSGLGDHTRENAGAAFGTPLKSFYYLAGVDVYTARPVNVVATLGDSITDGTGTSLDAHRRWPDVLQRRLNALRPDRRMSVANAGLAGNSLTTSLPLNLISGEPGLKRVTWDALDLAGVTDVIVSLGTNDMGFAVPPNYNAASLIAGYKRVARIIHEHGVRAFVTTQLPSNFQTHGNLLANRVRNKVNSWIAQHGKEFYDGVFDFAAAVRNAHDPNQIDARFDSGDGVHPNDLGANVLANTVKVRELSGSPCLAGRDIPDLFPATDLRPEETLPSSPSLLPAPLTEQGLVGLTNLLTGGLWQ